ncbi:MAG: hypothetical protein Q4G33_04615 [bacterium]|nr:hypothetical protein [bacterium]
MAKELRTGLEGSADKVSDEYDLVKALIHAGHYRDDEDYHTVVNIKRRNKHLFSFTVRLLGDDEIFEARLAATKFIPNPAGKEYPNIRGDVNDARYTSALVYMATLEEDQRKIWDNEAVKNEFGIIDPIDMVDQLLLPYEKKAVLRVIGQNDDNELKKEDAVKN